MCTQWLSALVWKLAFVVLEKSLTWKRSAFSDSATVLICFCLAQYQFFCWSFTLVQTREWSVLQSLWRCRHLSSALLSLWDPTGVSVWIYDGLWPLSEEKCVLVKHSLWNFYSSRRWWPFSLVFLTPKWPRHGQWFLIWSSSSGEVDQKHQVFDVGNLLNGTVQLTVEVVPHFCWWDCAAVYCHHTDWNVE